MLHLPKRRIRISQKKQIRAKQKAGPSLFLLQNNLITFLYEKKKNTKWSSRENIKNQDKEVEAKYK